MYFETIIHIVHCVLRQWHALQVLIRILSVYTEVMGVLTAVLCNRPHRYAMHCKLVDCSLRWWSTL